MGDLKARLWQQFMIRLACSGLLTRFMHNNCYTSGLARRFVDGGNADELVRTAHRLHDERLLTSIYYLGEYVNQPDLVENNVQQILQVIEKAGDQAPEVFICVDPTQIGYSISDELGWENAQRIASVFVSQSNARFMMIDMEDHTYVQKTIDLYCRLRDKGVPVAITLQSYLYRTDDDVVNLTQGSATIRLVKGAFAESKDIARTRKTDIDAAFLRHARLLLKSGLRERGVYPIFATHDDRIIDALKPEIQRNGWQAGEYEIEMLLGVRDDYQRELASEGHPMRVYVPFGTAWWPYAARRLGENPANARFALRAIMRGR